MRTHVGFTVGLVVAMLAASAGTASGASPAAFWHMDETSGSVARDGTGHGYNGAIQNVRLGVAGVTRTGFQFNGTSSRILVKDARGLRAGAKDLVVTVWVAFTTVPDVDYDLVRKGLSWTPGGHWKVEIMRSNGAAKAYCYWKGSSGSAAKIGGPNLADGRYHKITCEKRATTIALVVDGKRYSSTKTIGRIDNTAQLAIGAKAGSGGDWHEGRMDEVSVTIG